MANISFTWMPKIVEVVKFKEFFYLLFAYRIEDPSKRRTFTLMLARARSGKTSRECGRIIIISHQVDRWKSTIIRSRFIFSEHSDFPFESCDGTFLIDDKILVTGSTTFGSVVTLRRLSTVSYVHDPDDITATQWTWYWMDENGCWRKYGFDDMVSCYPISHQEKRPRLYAQQVFPSRIFPNNGTSTVSKFKILET